MNEKHVISITVNKAAEKRKNRLPNLGISAHSLFEIAGLFLVVIAVDHLFFGGQLNGMVPHPFWIPVILISVQYGTINGLITAVTAIFLVQFIGSPVQGVQESYYQYLLKVSMEPALWLGVAIVLGEMRMRHIAENKRINGQLQTLEKEHQCIAEYCQSLQAEIEQLEHKIAIQTPPSPSKLKTSIKPVKAA